MWRQPHSQSKHSAITSLVYLSQCQQGQVPLITERINVLSIWATLSKNVDFETITSVRTMCAFASPWIVWAVVQIRLDMILYMKCNILHIWDFQCHLWVIFQPISFLSCQYCNMWTDFHTLLTTSSLLEKIADLLNRNVVYWLLKITTCLHLVILIL